MRNIMFISAAAIGVALSGCAPAGTPQTIAEDTAYYDAQHPGSPAAKPVVQHVATSPSRAQAEAAARAKIKCEQARQNASNRGAAIGGIGGAVIGSQVAGHGAKTEGAIIGGLGGILAGRQIAKKNHRC